MKMDDSMDYRNWASYENDPVIDELHQTGAYERLSVSGRIRSIVERIKSRNPIYIFRR
jgi:hypothetical protein